MAIFFYSTTEIRCSCEVLDYWIFCFSVHVHADSRIGIHTPYLRVGLRMRKTAQSDQKVHFTVESGKQYKLTYNIPQDRRDIAHVK